MCEAAANSSTDTINDSTVSKDDENETANGMSPPHLQYSHLLFSFFFLFIILSVFYLKIFFCLVLCVCNFVWVCGVCIYVCVFTIKLWTFI